MWRDARFAVRALAKRPGFAAVAMATLALGIGANTAIFSLIHAVLLRPLPYADAERVVRVRGATVGTNEPGNLSPMDFLDFQGRMRRFDRLAAYNNYADATLTGAGDPERLAGTRVTADFFAVLHVTPALGRDFRADDDQPGARAVAIFTNGFWKRRFASDPSVVGRTVYLNSVPTDVIGVLPASFRHPFPENAREPDVFVPFKLDRKENLRSGHYLQAIALLKPDTTIADGQADLASIASDLEHEYPESNTGRTIAIQPLFDSMVGGARSALYILLGTVVFVLLIACANLANLLLARATSRQREIAVRRALGASRAQLLRQFLVESVVLAAAGGVCGLLLAVWAVRALAVLGADRIPRADGINIDFSVMLFTLALSIVTGLVFGVGPAVYATRAHADGHGALKDGGRTGEGRMQRRAQQSLIVSEVALALMLLVSAGLLVKSFWKLEHVDPGFRADHVLTFKTSLPIARYPEGDEIPFYQHVEARLAPLPGVRRVGAVQILPLSSDYSCDGFDIEGRPPSAPGQQPCAEHRTITPGYFDAMAIPLLRGRAFTAHDEEHGAQVAIISDVMAGRFWPHQDPIGARIVYQKATRTIVGIVASVKHFGLDRDAPFEMYTPHAQQPSYHTMTIVIRTPVEAASLMPSIRRELAALDRDVPISSVKTMEQVVDDSTREPRFRTLLVGAFAAVAVLLSIVGVAGVIAYAVGRRTQEIGVRVALGATAGRVTSMMLAEGLRPTLVGAAIGLAGSFAVTRVLSGLLFGVASTDPFVFGAATTALIAAALAATLVPARRAATVDPMIALRAD